MAILKALPGSAKINGKPVKGKLIEIKKSVINIGNFLDKRKEQTEKQIEITQKQNQNFKRRKKEEKLETPKNEWKKLIPKKIPGLSFLDSIKKFIGGWIFGFVAIKLIPLLPSLIPVVVNLGKMVNFIINIGGKFLNGFISFIDFGIKAQEATFGFIKNLGGEKFANAFERFTNVFGGVIDGMLLLGGVMLAEALAGDGGALDGLGDLVNPKKLKNFGKTVVSQGTKLAKGTWGAVKTVGAGLKAAAPALGWIASAGLLASAIGEGGAQLLKFGKHLENNAVEASKKAKDTPWWNPMKYWHMLTAAVLGVTNRLSGATFGLFDILGTPFRLIIEGLRWPFMNEDQRDKAALNLEKFDARIRDQFRGFFNMFDFLNVVPDKPGSWGNIEWSDKGSGTDEMGYTEDGKPKEAKTLFSKESDEEIEKLKADTTEKNKFNLQGAIAGGAVAGLPGVIAGSAIASDMNERFIPKGTEKTPQLESKKSSGGFKRMIGGVADFMTGGMFDFDKQNRRGAPKGFGIKRIAGGLADFATMGLTDFDKRGKGNFQFDPISGGKDKAWGKEYKTPARIKNFRNRANELRNMGQFGTKDGRTISLVDMLMSGDRSQIEEALYMQRSRKRGAGEGYSDWVGNPEYEAETLKYLKPQFGKQAMKFDEQLLGVSASYETDGGQKEYTIYAPSTQINMLPGNNDSGQLVTSGASASSGDDPYEILEKG